MKIEKVNDNQIRCTLTKADLTERELKISELAYGTEKAKGLFRDMIQQAYQQFGFQAEDIPLMIEAIPLNADCIVLIITKVEDPEELDTRFSKFAPSVHEGDTLDEIIQDLTEGADDVLDLFKKIHGERSAKKDGRTADQKDAESSTLRQSASSDKQAGAQSSVRLTRIFSFATIHNVLRLARVMDDFYRGTSSLYKDSQAERYILFINNDAMSPDEFNRVCNCLSEYGSLEKSLPGSEAYLQEHCELILGDNALEQLARI